MVVAETPRVRIDERAEFDAAFREVSRSAFLLARHLGRDTDAAADAVQDAALRAWRYRSTRTGDFRPWFLAIVYRAARGRMPEWLPLPRGWDRAATGPIAPSLDRRVKGGTAPAGAPRVPAGAAATGPAAGRRGTRGTGC